MTLPKAAPWIWISYCSPAARAADRADAEAREAADAARADAVAELDEVTVTEDAALDVACVFITTHVIAFP